MIWIGLIAIIVTITAALVEARGYIYSFAAFKEGFNPTMLALSFAWYALGIALDYGALYLLSKSTIFIPELLAVIFMVSTLIAIAVLSESS